MYLLPDLNRTRLVAAVDVGLPVNPDGVINQVEGGCIQAASWTLFEAVALVVIVVVLFGVLSIALSLGVAAVSGTELPVVQ